MAPTAVLMVPVLEEEAATKAAAMVSMARNAALTHIEDLASTACLILLGPPPVGNVEMAMVPPTAVRRIEVAIRASTCPSKP